MIILLAWTVNPDIVWKIVVISWLCTSSEINVSASNFIEKFLFFWRLRNYFDLFWLFLIYFNSLVLKFIFLLRKLKNSFILIIHDIFILFELRCFIASLYYIHKSANKRVAILLKTCLTLISHMSYLIPVLFRILGNIYRCLTLFLYIILVIFHSSFDVVNNWINLVFVEVGYACGGRREGIWLKNDLALTH